MKKTKFKPRESLSHDFSVFTISTTMADYKLAFELNRKLKLNFTKQADLPVYVSENKAVNFPFFFYKNEDEAECFLIEDRISGEPMIRSFLLFVKGHFDAFEIPDIPDEVSLLDDIFNCNNIDFQDTKNKKGKAAKISRLVNNILSDLEYHLLEITRQAEEQKVKLKPTQTSSIRKLYNN